MNGKKEVTALEISPDIVDPDDIETLSDVIIAAFNEGIKRVENEASEKMGQITGGIGNLGIPGIF